MAISAEHRSKFAAIHRQWWRLHMSEKFSSGTITAYNQPTNQLYNGEITEGRSTSFTTWKYGTEREEVPTVKTSSKLTVILMYWQGKNKNLH